MLVHSPINEHFDLPSQVIDQPVIKAVDFTKTDIPRKPRPPKHLTNLVTHHDPTTLKYIWIKSKSTGIIELYAMCMCTRSGQSVYTSLDDKCLDTNLSMCVPTIITGEEGARAWTFSSHGNKYWSSLSP